MKIVIDTEKLQTTPYYAKNCVVTMEDIIKCGTPLPKGHGRLIDANNITFSEFFDAGDYAQAMRGIYNSPTIIEADKESD